jgi:signal transduction histidine kinase
VKLLYKTTQNFLLAMAIILSIAGIVLYLLLRQEVTDEIQEQLELQADLVADQVAQGKIVNFPLTTVSEVSTDYPHDRRLGDTLIYDRLQRKNEGYYYLKLVKNVNHRTYQIMVMTSYIGWERYYKTIFISFLGVALWMAFFGVLINYYSNRKIWRPFFLNLENLKQFSVRSAEPLQWHDSTITEFKELYYSLKDLTERSRREYLALREFTENASHEIQTPLGIIQSKLDRMSQLEVSEEMARYIVQAKSGVERLSKMNKNLLLLAKLDNQVYSEKQLIHVDELLNQHLEQMEELFSVRNITISKELRSVQIKSDRYLCDVLLSNLLSNALRYTSPPSEIFIFLNEQQLIICNPGSALDFPSEHLFGRFTKSADHRQGTGLGLAIVHQICLLNGWSIEHSYETGIHCFSIDFN